MKTKILFIAVLLQALFAFFSCSSEMTVEEHSDGKEIVETKVGGTRTFSVGSINEDDLTVSRLTTLL